MKRWYFLSPLILQKLIWIPTRLALIFFGRLQVRGLDNLESIKSNVIFACNHLSELDPILVPAALPFWSHFSPMFYTSRERAFYDESGWRRYFYGGAFFKAWGAYPVRVGLNDYEKSLRIHTEIVRDGENICVFPEGEIARDGSVQQAKGGVAYLAHVTGAPIVPVRLEGISHLSFADFLLRKRTISIHFGKPLYVASAGNSPIPIKEFKERAKMAMGMVEDLVPKES